MLTQIGGKRESNFTEPLGMLTDCHKRIQYFLRSLVVLAEHALDGPLSRDQRLRLETALRYFREGGPRHTADEEQSLFPRMRLIDTLAVREALAKIEDLEAEHRYAEARHREVDVIGQRWLSQEYITGEEATRLSVVLAELARLYDRHIIMEENEIFAVARTVLSDAEKEIVGQEMARRRGILLRPVDTELRES